MNRDEERRIIAQVCAGDANAFEALVVAYQKQVYNLALRTVGSEEDAADMTQEVFLRWALSAARASFPSGSTG